MTTPPKSATEATPRATKSNRMLLSLVVPLHGMENWLSMIESLLLPKGQSHSKASLICV